MREQNSVLKHQNPGNLRLYGDLYHILDHQCRPWRDQIAQVKVFRRKSMVLCHACVRIIRITEGFGPPESPMGGPDRPSKGFPQKKHGFVPCMYENSENYRRIWTTSVAPREGACGPSARFPKEKHGFVAYMYENSENYRRIWTTRVGSWGGMWPK